MKKIVLICSTVLLGFGLTGCGNQDKHSEKHSSVKSEKVSSKKSSKSSSSSSMSSSSSSVAVASSSATIESQPVAESSSSAQQQATNNQVQNNYQQNEAQWAQQQGYQDPNSTAAKMGYAVNCVDNGYYPDGTPVSAEQQEEINKQRGYDTKGNPVMPGQGHAPGCDPFGNDDAWVAGQK